MSTELDQSVLDLIEGAPSAASAPEAIDAPGQSESVSADTPAVAPAPPESWRACTGQEIQAMIKAHQAGFVRTPGFTKQDVLAFNASKGIF